MQQNKQQSMEEFDFKSNVDRLKQLIKSDSRVAFYPSAGTHVEAFDFLKLPLDFVICCDYGVEQKQLGKIITVKAENNTCLRIILEAGIKLDAIFAIQDGFHEGGNFEFINSIGFLGRLLPALKDKFVLVNNPGNSSYHDFSSGPIKKLRNTKNASLYRSGTYSTYNHNVNDYKIISYKKDYTCTNQAEISIGKRIKVWRKSIWEDQNRLDGIFVRTTDIELGNLKESLKHYTPEKITGNKIIDITELTPQGSIVELLEYALQHKMRKIGLVPFAKFSESRQSIDTVYENMLIELENWDYAYPEKINFYHMDKGDFKPVYQYISENKPSLNILRKPIDTDYMIFYVSLIEILRTYNETWDERVCRLIEHFWVPVVGSFLKDNKIPQQFEGSTYNELELNGNKLPPACMWVSKTGRFSAHDLAYILGTQGYMLWDIERKVLMPVVFHDLEGIDEENEIVFCRTLPGSKFHSNGFHDPLKVNIDWIEMRYFWKSDYTYANVDQMDRLDAMSFLSARAQSTVVSLESNESDVSNVYRAPNYWIIREENFKRILSGELTEDEAMDAINEIYHHPLHIFWNGDEDYRRGLSSLTDNIDKQDEVIKLIHRYLKKVAYDEIEKRKNDGLPF